MCFLKTLCLQLIYASVLLFLKAPASLYSGSFWKKLNFNWFLISLVGNATCRGCSSSINLPADYKLKTTCQDEYCNLDVFPTDRLTCYKCKGSDCATPSGKSRACINYRENDECYTDVISATETIRGCLSDGNFTLTDYTVTCNTSLCNGNPSTSQLQCISCTSNGTVGCIGLSGSNSSCEINTTTTCEMNLLLGRDEYCFTYQKGDYVQRGCSAESNLTMNELDGSEKITKCNSVSCNNECIEQPKCIVCNSTEDANCLSSFNETLLQTCGAEDSLSCFTCLDEDGSISRGCGSGFDNVSNQCATCVDDYCNNQTISECYTCSSVDDLNCLNPGSSHNITTTKCVSKCLTKITNETTTERGCQSESFSCESNDLACVPCTGSLCNNDTTPSANFHCYQCRGESSCQYLNATDEATLCPDFGAAGCYQFIDEANNMIRGCIGDNNTNECIDVGRRCYYCREDSCNDLPLTKPANLSCIQCSNEEDCPWGFEASSGKECNETVFYYDQPVCYVLSMPLITSTVVRGCFSDLYTCLLLGFACQSCSTNDCNRYNAVVQHCLQCNGSLASKCGVGKYPTSDCPGNFMTYEQRGCYMKREDDYIERGCLQDFSAGELQSCLAADPKNCTACYGESCNTQNANSTSKLQVSFSIFLTIVVILMFKHNFDIIV